MSLAALKHVEEVGVDKAVYSPVEVGLSRVDTVNAELSDEPTQSLEITTCWAAVHVAVHVLPWPAFTGMLVSPGTHWACTNKLEEHARMSTKKQTDNIVWLVW